MVSELDDKNGMEERSNQGNHFLIIRNWDKTIGSLQSEPGLISLSGGVGFSLEMLTETLTRPFPEGVEFVRVDNSVGEKIEDVATEALTVNGRPLDRLLVVAFPQVANPSLTEMTKFGQGGEIIWITEGKADITYATETTAEYISKTSLKTEKVERGDLIISTDTPNNWTKVYGDKFTFIYFIGNPDGPQKYSEIPKKKIPVK